MRQDTTGTRRGTRRVSVLVAVGVLLGAALTPVVQTVTAAPAQAATVAYGAVEAQLVNHRGTNGAGAAVGDAGSNCIRYAPAAGTWSGTQVRAAHGNQQVTSRTRNIFGFWNAWETSYQCPTALGEGFQSNTFTQESYSNGQSIIGFSPTTVTSVTTGTSFLLGTFRHYNNPVTSSANYYEGSLGVRLGSSSTVSSPYVLWETPNNATPASNAANNDTVTFGSLIRRETVTLNGMSYRLTVQGFTTAGTGTVSCASSPSGTFSNTVSTVEETTTVACLWARLDQVRPVTVAKQVAAAGDAPAGIPAATFSATSTMAGSAWTATPLPSLTPTSLTGAGSTATAPARDLMTTSESVTVTEGAPPAGWELTRVACTDGTGAALTTGVTVSTSARTLTLAGVPDATSPAALAITCTFLNTYVAPTTLTLVSQTMPGTTLVPTAGWTFAVDAVAGSLTTAGAAGSVQTTVAVPAANRVVRVTETVQTGFVVDRVTCTGTDGSSVTTSAHPVDVTLLRGRSYTCTVVNLRPGVALVKEAFLATDTAFTTPLATGQQRQEGTAVVWRYTVRNTGQTALTSLVLRDAFSATTNGVGTTTGFTTITCPGLTPGPTVTIPSLAVGASVACTAPGVL